MGKNNASRSARLLAAVVATVLTVAGTTALTGTAASAADQPSSPPPLLQRDDSVVTSDPIPTVQIDNGYVWAQETIGTTVYAVGKFDNARAALAAPGTQLTTRSNILAYDITTGEMLPFAPRVNGVIKAVAASPDGSRIYIGGSFNTVNDQRRWNFAALDAQTGELVSGFSPSIGGSGVYALSTSGSSVYVGGLFTQANGTARKNLAAFNASNGALLPWAPQTDLQVDAMVMDPGGEKVVVGGRFAQLNGDTALRGVAAVDKTTGGADTGWQLNQTVKNGASNGKAGIFGLATDDTAVYGTGWVYGGVSIGNLEGAFAAESGSGQVRWIADCLGDHYGVYSTGSVVYTTSHTHSCPTMGMHPEQSPTTHRYAEAFTTDVRGTLPRNPRAGSTYQNWEGTAAPSAYNWTPDWAVGTTTGLGQAGLSITGAGDFISIGGEFRSVNNGRFEGLVRFSTNPPGGAKDGPRLSGTSWAASAQSTAPGRVRVSFPANWDRDDLTLTYELVRDGQVVPGATTTANGTWWNRPEQHIDDGSATPGAEHTYTVVARDSAGNTATSAPVTVTVAEGETSAYGTAVLDDGAQLYYPLGTSREDWAGTNDPVFRSAVSETETGLSNTISGASRFDGSSNGAVVSSARVTAPGAFSTEIWFRTTTTSGGKLIGYGGSNTGESSTNDRHIYMTNDGSLYFGVYNGAVQTINSSAGLNDGQWHHAVATQGADGMALYVDGRVVATNKDVTTAENQPGYWRIGGDTMGSSWHWAPSSAYFNGDLDEAAVYPAALTAEQVNAHYGLAKGMAAPTATFTAQADALELSVDASASAPAEGASIESYEWNFGDGATGDGAAAVHEYAEAGTYTVAVTVVDSNGLRSTSTQEIAVSANQAPVADFSLSADGRTVSADASASSDPDGTVASYSWSWGDESEGDEGQQASHEYAADGTYTVTLTVTDDRGATTSATRDIRVIDVAPGVVASDTFERATTAGWGTADLGGEWAPARGSAAVASTADGTGQLALRPADTRDMVLQGTTVQDARASVTYTLDGAPSTGVVYAGVALRHSAAGSYRALAWHRADGSIWLVIQRNGAAIASTPLAGQTWDAGSTFHIAAEAVGSGETTVRVKLWADGAEEPANWQLQKADGTAELQSEGAAAVFLYRASSASGDNVVRFDDFLLADVSTAAE